MSVEDEADKVLWLAAIQKKNRTKPAARIMFDG
jgi:hypothetical protein